MPFGRVGGASILAKTARDEVMRDLDSESLHYDFGGHKGYGTAQHTAALRPYLQIDGRSGSLDYRLPSRRKNSRRSNYPGAIVVRAIKKDAPIAKCEGIRLS